MYQTAHDTTTGSGVSSSSVGAGSGITDYDDQPTIIHTNEDASSRRRRWVLRMAMGMMMTACLVLIGAVVLGKSDSPGGSGLLRRGPGPALEAASMEGLKG